MTEDEAKGKRCPMSFSGNTLEPCRASGCMAWRWEAVDLRTLAPSGPDYEARARALRPGFCGLAGAPNHG